MIAVSFFWQICYGRNVLWKQNGVSTSTQGRKRPDLSIAAEHLHFSTLSISGICFPSLNQNLLTTHCQPVKYTHKNPVSWGIPIDPTTISLFTSSDVKQVWASWIPLEANSHCISRPEVFTWLRRRYSHYACSTIPDAELLDTTVQANCAFTQKVIFSPEPLAPVACSSRWSCLNCIEIKISCNYVFFVY